MATPPISTKRWKRLKYERLLDLGAFQPGERLELVGVELTSGSAIIDPLGQVPARATASGDELVSARLDLHQMLPERRRWSFPGRRQPQHYAPLRQPVTKKKPNP